MNPLPPVAAAAGPAPVARPVPNPTPSAPASASDFAAALRTASSAMPPPRAATPPGLSGRLVLDAGLLDLGRAAPAPPGDARGGAAFTARAYGRLGVVLSDDLQQQATMGVAVASMTDARSGDLVVLGRPPHTVGLYAGSGRMLHAPVDGGPVAMRRIEGSDVGIRRIVDDPRAAVAGPTAFPLPTTPATPAPAGASTTLSPSGPSAGAAPFASLFEQAASRHGVDAALLAAVARVESNFDPRATSRAGAQGLMQFMPATAAGMGVDPWDPASAIDGAARYLRQGIDRFGSVELALASYNAGPNAVRRHGGIPPFPETQQYVRKVLQAREQYLR